MKRFLIAIAAIAIMASCDPKESEEYKQVNAENEQLREEAQARDSQLETLSSSMAEIESNLQKINVEREKVDSLKAAPGDQKERINAIIENINGFLIENKEKVERLEKMEGKLKASQRKTSSLNRIIAQLKKKIDANVMQIDSLTRTIDGLNVTVTTLQSDVTRRDSILASREQDLAAKSSEYEEADMALNKAHYAIGSAKDLEEAGIVDRKGGLLGIGKKTKLEGGFDLDKMRAIDIRNIQEFDLGQTKKPAVLTSHPANSYSLLNNDGNVTLKITDYKAFWRNSKVLVVVTN